MELNEGKWIQTDGTNERLRKFDDKNHKIGRKYQQQKLSFTFPFFINKINVKIFVFSRIIDYFNNNEKHLNSLQDLITKL